MNSSFEQTIERLAIDAEIRDLAARFSDAVNRRDPDAFGDLLADDGVWEIGEPFPSRHLLEQPPPHARGGYPDLWHEAVGQPAPAVLAVAHPGRHRLDEREPLPAHPRSRPRRRAAGRLPCIPPTPSHPAAHPGGPLPAGR